MLDDLTEKLLDEVSEKMLLNPDLDFTKEFINEVNKISFLNNMKPAKNYVKGKGITAIAALELIEIELFKR